MVIEQHPPESRRRWLQHGLAAIACGVVAWPTQARGERGHWLAAAWDDASGRHFIGRLAWPGSALGAVRVLASIEVPTRAHGLLVEPDGAVLAVARRPGEWLLRWHADAPGATRWQVAEPDRRFNGHLLREAGSGHLISVETDLASGHSVLAVRDGQGLAVRDEWPVAGIDAHELLQDADGSLLLAVGGVPSLPESGRVKRGLPAMASALLRLDACDGHEVGRWELGDARLSMRHLARHAGGAIGIALQAEHDAAEAKAAAPVLAWFDGSRLRVGEQPSALAGYGGSIVATAEGFAIGAPRAGGIARWCADGRWLGLDPLAEACAISATPSGGWCAGGAVAARRDDLASPVPLPPMRLDNHWVLATAV
ncbi:MAG: DUF1513 domain-containing protein [Vitreoscilla sp.]|nr:DUF1513 domain-containing protein [Vitreoscilla sp.]